MDPGDPVVLIVAIIAGLSVLMLGLSWLFNGSWPWQRPPHGSDEIDRERIQDRGMLGRFFSGFGGLMRTDVAAYVTVPMWIACSAALAL